MAYDVPLNKYHPHWDTPVEVVLSSETEVLRLQEPSVQGLESWRALTVDNIVYGLTIGHIVISPWTPNFQRKFGRPQSYRLSWHPNADFDKHTWPHQKTRPDNLVILEANVEKLGRIPVGFRVLIQDAGEWHLYRVGEHEDLDAIKRKTRKLAHKKKVDKKKRDRHPSSYDRLLNNYLED